jgi:uncharacterized protein (DUF2062 family)
MGRIRNAIKLLLHVDDTPHRIALSFGIGVWIAFFPLWGIHTAMALLIAFALRLSRAAMVLGAYVNNPWTMGPFYTAGTMLGCLLLGVPIEGFEGLDWSLEGRAFFDALVQTLRPYLWPFVVGNTLAGVFAGLLGYFALRWALERRRGPSPAAGAPSGAS